MDRLILGANPLYGVDHFLGERARERALRLTSERVYSIMKAAFSAGATGFNFSPHPLIYGIFEQMRNEGYDYAFNLYPMLPDMKTYTSAQLNSGTIGMLRQLLANLGVAGSAKVLLQGGLSWLTADPIRAMKLYLDIEIKKLYDIMPSRSKLATVLAHEVLTDMALAFGSDGLLKGYSEHVRDKYGVKPGFVTRNFPRFVEFSTQCNLPIREMVIMTPFNKIGFQMTPSRELCEMTLSTIGQDHLIAMSVLAGGQINFDEATEYLKSLNVKSIAIGVSTDAHAKETFHRLSQIFGTS